MKSFTTHTGAVITGEPLRAALRKVADDWRELARAIREEDGYAPHVSEDVKQRNLEAMLATADEIEAGNVRSFTIAQRLDIELTGECIALLGGGK